MSEEKSILDILLDEEDTGNIVLQDDDGKDIELEQVAVIPLDERLFVILHPLNVDGMAADEALVFEYQETDDGESLFVVEDDELSKQVFDEYHKLCDEE